MSAPAGDLRSLGTTLRRRAWILATAALLGLLGGLGYVLVVPTPLTSTSLVLLPTPALAESSSSDVDTQVRVATSAGILERAGSVVGAGLSVRQVESMIKVSSATSQLLQIDATSPRADEAQRLSQAVADSYVAYVRDTAREVTVAALSDLSKRRDDLQSQISQLQKEITASVARRRDIEPGSAEDRDEARVLAGLRAQQADLSLQLDKVRDKIAAGTPVGSSATGTSVVQAATVASGPSLVKRLLVTAPAGALAAFILAGIAVFVLARRDPRVRLRDDIADAISSPVLASVKSRPQTSVAAWTTLLLTYEATPVESWALRQVLRSLVGSKAQQRGGARPDHPQSLTVVSLSDDPRGLAVGPQLAAFAASLGVLTRLVPVVGQEDAPALWACLNEASAVSRPHLVLGPRREDEGEADLTVHLVVVDRARPDLRQLPASDAVVLSVAAGTANEQQLARVAVAVDDVSRHIDGIVVADPDPADRTTGRHTIAERSQWPALPTKLTGVATTRGSANNRSGRS